MAQLDRPGGRWRRRLFGSDAWWRITAAGIVAGVAFAFFAALVAALVGGGSGSLDEGGPTAVAPAAGPAVEEPAGTEPLADETLAPAATEVEPAPTEPPVPTELPTEPPPVAPTATEAAAGPSATPEVEGPTPGPTAPGADGP